MGLFDKLKKIEKGNRNSNVDSKIQSTDGAIDAKDYFEADLAAYNMKKDTNSDKTSIPGIDEVKQALEYVNWIDNNLNMYVDFYHDAVDMLKKLLLNDTNYVIEGISTTIYLYTLIKNKQKYLQAIIEEEYKNGLEYVKNYPYDDEEQRRFSKAFVNDIIDYVNDFNHATKKCAEIHLDKFNAICESGIDYKSILYEENEEYRFPNTDIGDDVFTEEYSEGAATALFSYFLDVEDVKNNNLVMQIKRSLSFADIDAELEDECRKNTIILMMSIDKRKMNKIEKKIESTLITYRDKVRGYSTYIKYYDDMLNLNKLMKKSVLISHSTNDSFNAMRDNLISAIEEEYLPRIKNGSADYDSTTDEMIDIIYDVDPEGSFEPIANEVIDYIVNIPNPNYQNGAHGKYLKNGANI